MTKKQYIQKIIVALFMCLLLHNTSFAQGPTSPEAASFEPVDATDMVNLVTGDLSYVLPLLNVPGPNGGYPISLSYHAGIAMEQEATWVGLGWNLNPGAINRSINGYPDDWNNRKKTSILYDKGGIYTVQTVTASTGWKDGKYSAGLYASYAVNRAFGGETTYDTKYGATLEVGKNKFSAGTDGVGYSRGMSSVNYNSNNGTVSVGLDIGALGISLSSDGNHYLKIAEGSVGISGSGGLSSKMHTRTIGTSIDGTVNIGGIANFGYSKRKYRYTWYDRASYDCLGILYAGQTDEMIANSLQPKNASIDSYQSIYKTADNRQSLENNFSGPSYDNYTVTSEGLSGSISPYLFEHGTFKNRYNRVTTTYDNKYAKEATFSYYDNSFSKQINDPNNDINFYFENINASYMSLKSDGWGNLSSANKITDLDVINKRTNHTSIVNGVSQSNYNALKNRINNGPFIEVFTNSEILKNRNSIIDVATVNRASFPSDGIGAYRITNADGLTYHYSLPVYQKEMFSRSGQLEDNINDKFYEEQQFTPYATHWLLTAITGPDYIDNNNNNKADNLDFGYWVVFDYGKWSDGYAWRTPTQDLSYHESDQSKSFAWGVKEIYYLDMIKTKTHTALFVKEDRRDNYGSKITIGASINSPESYNYGEKQLLGQSNSNYFVKGIYDNRAVYLAAGVYYSNIFHKEYVNIDKHKSLRLKEILLLRNEDVPSNIKTYRSESRGRAIGQMYFAEEVIVYDVNGRRVYNNNYPLLEGGLKSWKGEFYNNIINSKDIYNNISNVNDVKINHISLGYDGKYPLRKNTPNSYPLAYGKLTLDKVDFRGREAVSVIPPYRFSYASSLDYYNRRVEDEWGYNEAFVENSSLSKIITPTHQNIQIRYEEDDFYQEAATNYRTYNAGIQYNFYRHNGKIRIVIENKTNTPDNTYFEDYFEVGTPVKIDMWAAFKAEYWEVFGGCKNRVGSINIPNEFVNVISVSNSNVVLETTLDKTYNHNEGLNWLLDAGPMGVGFSDHDMQNRLRGEYPALPDGCAQRRAVVFLGKIYAKNSKRNIKGGGIRVKSIETTSNSLGGNKQKTVHYYNDLDHDKNVNDDNYKSSGITSYAPAKYNKEVEYLSELPSPGVNYEYVTVENLDANNELVSRQVYNFKTLKPFTKAGNVVRSSDIIEIEKEENQNSGATYSIGGEIVTISTAKYTIKDNRASIGQLKKVSSYNSKDHLLSKTLNFYVTPNDNNPGTIQETFDSYTKINYQSATNKYLLNTSTRIKLTSPLGLKSTTENSYSTLEAYAYDFNTGKLNESRVQNSNGNNYRTEIIPAYTIPEYSDNLIGYGMGSKVDNITNKNMLTQPAITKKSINNESIIGNDNWKTISVGISTWNNQWSYINYNGSIETPTNLKKKVWRKHKNFIWDGDRNSDGIYTNYQGIDDNFNWSVGTNTNQPNNKWRNTTTNSIYDHFSRVIEIKDINNNYAITKTADNDSKIVMNSNARYGEAFYSGAEYNLGSNYMDQGVKGVGFRSLDYAHTGKYALKIAPNQRGFETVLKSGQHDADTYKVSVWIKKSNSINARIHINGATKPFNGETEINAGDWVLLNHYEELQTSNETLYITSVNGTVYMDDFRIHPIASTMTNYVYDEWDKLTFLIGPNNLSECYVYDKEGRLIETYIEIIDTPDTNGGFKKASSNSYKYLTRY